MGLNSDLLWGTAPTIPIVRKEVGRGGCLKYVGEYTEHIRDYKCCVCNKVLFSESGSGLYVNRKVPKDQVRYEEVSYRYGRVTATKGLWFCRSCYSATRRDEIVQQLEQV